MVVKFLAKGVFAAGRGRPAMRVTRVAGAPVSLGGVTTVATGKAPGRGGGSSPGGEGGVVTKPKSGRLTGSTSSATTRDR